MLIVDDSQINIVAINALLQGALDIPTDYALSGSITLEKVKRRVEDVLSGRGQMFKLLLLDFSMPGMDGPEVA